MSNIEKWAYINRAYDESTRSKILWKQYALKNIKNNLTYWFLLIGYVTVSAIALYLVFFYSLKYFNISILLILITALITRYFLEKRLSKDLSETYEPYKLNAYSISNRARYLHFIKFNELLVSTSNITPQDIEILLKWDDISAEKVDLSAFFKSKLFLATVTGIIALLVQYLYGLKLEANQLLVVIFLSVTLLWGFWIVFDFSTITKNRRLNIRRFLKWYELENTNNYK